MRRVLIIAMGLLAGCMPDPLGRKGADVRAEKAQCDVDGGQWRSGGLTGAMMCFRATPDAGKACARAGDCSGTCLSDTRSCSKVTPMFGCYGYLDETGQKIEICVD